MACLPRLRACIAVVSGVLAAGSFTAVAAADDGAFRPHLEEENLFEIQDDHLLRVSAGYAFDFGFAVDSHAFGALVSYAYGF